MKTGDQGYSGCRRNVLIKFYGTKNDKYGWMSNFSPIPIELDEKVWATTEHYYQAQKFTDEKTREQIRLSTTPHIAWKLGNSRQLSVREDWLLARVPVMKKAIAAKIQQNDDIKKKLLDTKQEVLIEDSKKDRFWGCGKDGEGQNQLGKIWMSARKELRKPNTFSVMQFTGCDCKIIRGKFDVNDIPLDCKATWDLICSGYTAGIFQLETKLGQDWARKIKPRNIEELGELGALLRPGCLDSKITEGFAKRKFGIEPVEYIHPILEPILKQTFGFPVYQEQSIRMCVDIAGFSLVEADTLRKGIGKKDAGLMAKSKKRFMEGSAEKRIVTEEQAEEIFSWIEKSQRYSFNKCVSGDTTLKRSGNKHKSRTPSVEEMYNIRNDIQYAKQNGRLSLYKKWKRIGNFGYGYSQCKDGRIRPNIIEDIQPAGYQEVLRICVGGGSYIDVTPSHKFPTPDGLVEAQNLEVGGTLYSCGEYEKSDFAKINRFTSKKQTAKGKSYDGRGFPDGENNPGYIDGSYIKFSKFKNETENVCSSCHKKKDYKLGRTKKGEKGYPPVAMKIFSIKSMGKATTWDVTMGDPNHTFVTDKNIVTCNSHSISYAMLGFQTAYCKAHFPVQFYTSYLTYAEYKTDPMEEIYKLVQDAKIFGVTVLPPDIKDGDIDFKADIANKLIMFGLGHIKGVGGSAIKKISENTGEMDSWSSFLSSVPSIHRNVGEALIKSGACDCFGMTRKRMVKELELVAGGSCHDENGNVVKIPGLTKKELVVFLTNHSEGKDSADILKWMGEEPENDKPLSGMKKQKLIDLIIEHSNVHQDLESLKKKDLVCRAQEVVGELPGRSRGCANGNRRQILRDKAEELDDNFDDTNRAKSEAEKYYLGVSLSCSAADDADDTDANATCIEFIRATNKTLVTICCVVDAVRHTKTKRGKNPGQPMCFLTVSDSTCSLDQVVVFPKSYKGLRAMCREGNVCLVSGTKNNGSLIVDEMEKML